MEVGAGVALLTFLLEQREFLMECSSVRELRLSCWRVDSPPGRHARGLYIPTKILDILSSF